ncbi:hypothetical protein Tco_0235951 [Tanacetum coccineum]
MTEQDSPPPTITTMKIPIIKKGEYDIWSIRMRQYIRHTDHNLWDIIVDGDLQEEATPAREQSGPPAPKTVKQLTAKRNQERVKSILLLAIPDEYLLKVYEDEMKRSSSSTSNSQNLAFLSSENTSSTNEVSTASGTFGVNTTRGTSSTNQVSSTPGADEVVCSFFAQQTTSPPLDNEDLKGYFAKECKSGRNQEEGSYGDNGRRNETTNEPSSQALVAQDGLGGYD